MDAIIPYEAILRFGPLCSHNEETNTLHANAEFVQEIVRCKDCKHYDGDYWCRNDKIPVGGDDASRFMPDPDFFCALCERRA